MQHNLQTIRYYQLHCSCIMLHLFFGILFDLMSNNMMLRNKNRKYVKKSMLTCISTGAVFVLVWLPELIEKVHSQLVFCLIAFQTHWKENSMCTPLPFRNLPLSDPLPLEISVTLHKGQCIYFLEPIFCLLL